MCVQLTSDAGSRLDVQTTRGTADELALLPDETVYATVAHSTGPASADPVFAG